MGYDIESKSIRNEFEKIVQYGAMAKLQHLGSWKLELRLNLLFDARLNIEQVNQDLTFNKFKSVCISTKYY